MTETHGKCAETHACDLISRQAAMDAIAQHLGRRNAGIILDHVPSVQQWIPYDYENIPSPGENVLVTYKCDDGTSEVAEGVWIQPFIVDNCFMDREVTAWMPLPEPWKGEE